MWEEVVRKIKEKTREGREIEYSEGAVGITSLLYCPLKWELRRRYPEVQSDAVEIDDGFLWEKQVKEALSELFGKDFEEEKVLEFEIEGVRIEGHLDTFVEFEDRVVGIELKAPKSIPLREVPPPETIRDNLLIDMERRYARVNDLYITQARIQKFLLERLYPHKKVEQFIFLKGIAEHRRWRKKLYVVYPVEESVSEEELREIVRRFKEDRSPRFPSECESYCEYYRQGLCEGKEVEYEDTPPDREVMELLKEYRGLQSQMKMVENLLKKKMKGSIKVGGREIGWVKRKVIEIDERKALSLLPPERIPEFFVARWNRKEDLVKELGEEVVKGVKEERTWRL